MKSQTTTDLLLAMIVYRSLRSSCAPFIRPLLSRLKFPNTDYFIEPGTYLTRAPDNSQQSYGNVSISAMAGHGLSDLYNPAVSLRSHQQ
jgi:hypothetical protein